MRLLSVALVTSLAAGMVLANGSAPRSERPREDPTVEDTCNATAYAHLIGQPFAEAEALDLDTPVRIFGMHAAVTMDFLPHRINFQYDDDGLIVRIYCG